MSSQLRDSLFERRLSRLAWRLFLEGSSDVPGGFFGRVKCNVSRLPLGNVSDVFRGLVDMMLMPHSPPNAHGIAAGNLARNLKRLAPADECPDTSLSCAWEIGRFASTLTPLVLHVRLTGE